jgi:DNA repair photolyase
MAAPLPAAQLELIPIPAGELDPVGWTPLDERTRGTRFVSLPIRSILNGPETTRMGFWSLNPYVGCEFGCAYCYARDTHRWTVERAEHEYHDDFERRILVKTEAAAVLGRTLNPAKLAGQPLVIGTATDPYQPAERRFRLTRRILEALLPYRGLSIEIITKSPLVARDLDVLRRLSARHEVCVNISLASLDAALLRRLEPRTPVPAARLRGLRRLVTGGVHAGVLVAPIIPGLTDGRRALARLMRAAKEAGARYVIGSALRLNPAARRHFLPVLDREFPELAERYRRHYARSDDASRAYRAALRDRLHELRRAAGIADTGAFDM